MPKNKTSEGKESPKEDAKEKTQAVDLDSIPEQFDGDITPYQQRTWGKHFGAGTEWLTLSQIECKHLLAFLKVDPGEIKNQSQKFKELKSRLDELLRGKFKGNPVNVHVASGLTDAAQQKQMPRTLKILSGLLDKEYKGYKYTGSAADKNRDLRCCIVAWRRILSCKGSEAIFEVMRHSDRFMAYLNGAVGKDEEIKMVIMESTEVDPSQLFRGFVYKGKITAISQYYHKLFFEDLHPDDLAEMQQRLTAVWPTKYHPKIGLDSYIFDFAMVATKVHVMTLHPFVTSTNPLLFDWDEHMERLQKGPCQLWYRQDPMDETIYMIHDSWRKWLNKYHGLPESGKQESRLFSCFRIFAMLLVMIMTAVSVYMYFTAPPAGRGTNRRRRRRGL